MKFLFCTLLTVLTFSANSFAKVPNEKSTEAQTLLRTLFQKAGNAQKLFELKGKTAGGTDCTVSLNGMVPDANPEFSVVLLDLNVAATDAQPEGVHLNFYLDSASEPKILKNTPDLVSMKQNDMHTRESSVEFNLGGQNIVSPYLEDYAVKDWLQIGLTDGKINTVSLKNDKSPAVCILP